MADLEFEVAKRRTKPITFTLGGDARLKDAIPAEKDEDDKIVKEAVPEERGEDEHVYKFAPPKNAVMLMPIFDRGDGTDDTNIELTKSTFDWLGEGLAEEDNQRILKRLKDPLDDLDVDHLNKVIEGLSAQVGGRPTT